MAGVTPRTSRSGVLVVGAVLIAAGLITYLLNLARIDVADLLGGSGWTLFIILPGLILLGASLLTARPEGAGLAAAGAVVTTVGVMLLVMDQTDHYESWAYAWALIPAAVGLALTVHGLRSGADGLVTAGTRLLLVAGILFVVGAWFFEAVFETGRPPFDLGDAWPLVLVALGAIVLVFGGLFGRPARSRRASE